MNIEQTFESFRQKFIEFLGAYQAESFTVTQEYYDEGVALVDQAVAHMSDLMKKYDTVNLNEDNAEAEELFPEFTNAMTRIDQMRKVVVYVNQMQELLVQTMQLIFAMKFLIDKEKQVLH